MTYNILKYQNNNTKKKIKDGMPAQEPSKEDSQKYKMSVSIPESKFAVNFCRKEAQWRGKKAVSVLYSTVFC